jgi:hypothetical protein
VGKRQTDATSAGMGRAPMRDRRAGMARRYEIGGGEGGGMVTPVDAADPMDDGEAVGDSAATEPMEDDAPTSTPTPSASSATAAIDNFTVARRP